MESIVFKIIENSLAGKNEAERLKKLFVLECKCNLKLLDTTSWDKVSVEFKREILRNLKTDAARGMVCFVDPNVVTSLFGEIKIKFGHEPNSEQDTGQSRIEALIARIETLVVLSNLPESLQTENKARYDIRIRNLRSLIVEILNAIDS